MANLRLTLFSVGLIFIITFTSCSLLRKQEESNLQTQNNSADFVFDSKLFDKISGRDNNYIQIYHNNGQLNYLFKKVLNKIPDENSKSYLVWQLLANIEQAVETSQIDKQDIANYVYKFKSKTSAGKMKKILFQSNLEWPKQYNISIEDGVYLILENKKSSSNQNTVGKLRDNALIQNLKNYNDTKYVLIEFVSLSKIKIWTLLRGPTNKMRPETPLDNLLKGTTSSYPEELRVVLIDFFGESLISASYWNFCTKVEDTFVAISDSDEVRDNELSFSDNGVIILSTAIVNTDLQFAMSLKGLKNPDYPFLLTVLDGVKKIYPVFNYKLDQKKGNLLTTAIVKNYGETYRNAFFKFQDKYSNIKRQEGAADLVLALDAYFKTQKKYPAPELFETTITKDKQWKGMSFGIFLQSDDYQFNYTLLKDGYLISAFPKNRDLERRFFAFGRINNKFVNHNRCYQYKYPSNLSQKEILEIVDQKNKATTYVIDLKKLNKNQ